MGNEQRISPDGNHWWDGSVWRPRSEDGRWWWDGAAWRAVPDPSKPVDHVGQVPQVTADGSLTGVETVLPGASNTDLMSVQRTMPGATGQVRELQNGAIVSSDGYFYWSNAKWEPLVPNPPNSAPGAWSGAERKAVAHIMRPRGLAGVGQVRQAGEELRRLISELGSLQAAEEKLRGDSTSQAIGTGGAASKGLREEAYERATRECPLPVHRERVSLPGGLRLMDDEFLVTTAKEWGLSSQQVVMTTHRAIWTHGRLSREQSALYLVDIRDVMFRKPVVGFGSIAFETASGQVIEALPSVANGTVARDALLALIHYARQRAQQPQIVVQTVTSAAPVAPAVDRYDQLRKLADLKEQGVLSEEEFQAEKERVLAG